MLAPGSVDEKTGQTVPNVLKSKYPNPQRIFTYALVDGQMPDVESVVVTSGMIEKSARTIRGSAGPSRGDAELWRDALFRFIQPARG